MNIPIIGSGKNTSKPLAPFAKKEKIYVPPAIMSEASIRIPPIWYWEDVVDGVSVMMTMAFKHKNMNYGMSYPLDGEKNVVKIDIMRKKLFAVVKESLDVIVHHGDKVLDSFGNIDPRLVNDQEAIRFKYDKDWDKKVAAFNRLVRVAPITKKKAITLGLLDQPKSFNT